MEKTEEETCNTAFCVHDCILQVYMAFCLILDNKQWLDCKEKHFSHRITSTEFTERYNYGRGNFFQ